MTDERLDRIEEKIDRLICLLESQNHPSLPRSKLWTEDEETEVMEELEEGMKFDEIAKKHSRTKKDIVTRMKKVARDLLCDETITAEMCSEITGLSKEQIDKIISDQKKDFDGKLTKEEDKLYEILRQWRNKIADDLDYKPFQIYTNKTLQHLAHFRPQTKDQLQTIYGVGNVKIDTYGKQTLDILKNAVSQVKFEETIHQQLKRSQPKIRGGSP